MVGYEETPCAAARSRLNSLSESGISATTHCGRVSERFDKPRRCTHVGFRRECSSDGLVRLGHGLAVSAPVTQESALMDSAVPRPTYQGALKAINTSFPLCTVSFSKVPAFNCLTAGGAALLMLDRIPEFSVTKAARSASSRPPL